jgi:Carboxypeptidase regulatory-like domain
MRNSKTLFKAKKATSIVMLLVTLLMITINLSSCSSKDGGVVNVKPTVGVVTGIVTDDGNAVVVGATVTLKQAGQKDRTATADIRGKYTFSDVPVGATVSLVCSFPQFINQNIPAFAVDSDLIQLNIVMIGDATVKTLIPDPKFEAQLIKEGYDTAPVDGSVPTYKINRVTSLAVGEITDLTGIQDFKALESLSCGSTTTTIKLTSLDVSKNTALKTLDCSDNNIATLNLSMNTALTELQCNSNPLLTTLNVTKNTALKILNYNDCSSLIALDLSQNTALEELYCFNNKLTTLDVSKNGALKKIRCFNNQLGNLDVSNNTALEFLDCNNNLLTTMNLSRNVALSVLDCSKNQLTTLDCSKNSALREFSCYINKLTTLDVSKNISLRSLYCDFNKLATLDVQNNIALIQLGCSSNQLATLDVHNNTALDYINCSFNKLTTLDVSKNKVLVGLYCNDNLLTTLNMKNGNNAKIIVSVANPGINFKNNVSGLVIAVDDVTFSKNNWDFYKDAGAIYVSSF